MTARAPRADAQRNRARILEAARAGFSADGPELSLDEIARRAGVGAGTVHRHFPTKESLLAAVVAERLDAMTALTRDRLDAPDQVAAFALVLAELARQARENLALTAALRGDVGAAAMQAGVELSDALAALLAEAQEAGGIRRDITVADLHAPLTGIIAMERALPAEHAGLGLDVLFSGLRRPS